LVAVFPFFALPGLFIEVSCLAVLPPLFPGRARCSATLSGLLDLTKVFIRALRRRSSACLTAPPGGPPYLRVSSSKRYGGVCIPLSGRGTKVMPRLPNGPPSLLHVAVLKSHLSHSRVLASNRSFQSEPRPFLSKVLFFYADSPQGSFFIWCICGRGIASRVRTFLTVSHHGRFFFFSQFLAAHTSPVVAFPPH